MVNLGKYTSPMDALGESMVYQKHTGHKGSEESPEATKKKNLRLSIEILVV